MLHKLTEIIENMDVDTGMMIKNVNITKNAYCSSKLLVALCNKGLSRKEAYEIVQKFSFDVMLGKNYLECEGYATIYECLNREEMIKYMLPQYYLEHIDSIYEKFDLESEEK